MQKIKWVLSIVFVMMCAFMFAEENDKHLYLKGESDGLEIKLRLLSHYELNYDSYSTLDELQNYLGSYFTSIPSNYNMLMVAAFNNFPVVITNNSNSSVEFNGYYDTLTFIVDGRQMLYEINVEGNEYPQKIFPSGKVLFTIQTLYSYQDVTRDIVQLKLGNTDCILNDTFAKQFLLNYWPLIMDFAIKKGKDVTPEKIDIVLNEISKTFYAVYEIGLEKKEVYLYPVYE